MQGVDKQREPLGLERDVANPFTTNSLSDTDKVQGNAGALGSQSCKKKKKRKEKKPALNFREVPVSSQRC